MADDALAAGREAGGVALAVGRASKPRSSAALFVVFAGAAFASSGPIARSARPLHPLVIAFGRLAVAGLLLGALDLRKTLAAARALSARQVRLVLAAGALLAGHFALFQWGLDRTSLAAAVSLVSLEPLSVVLWAWLISGLRPSRSELAGVLVATLGAVVVARGAGQGEHRIAGDLLVLGAVALYGLYLTIPRALASALPPRSYAALVYGGAALSLLLPVLAVPDARASELPLHGLVAIVALALVPTILGHTAVQTASRTLSPAIVALVSPGETLGAMAIGAALLGEMPTSTEAIGALIILAGSALAIFTNLHQKAESPP